MNKSLEDLIPEINALSRKSKTIGLTEEEKIRQQELRQAYLKIFRSQFEDQLSSVKVVDSEGNDVTPRKVIKNN